jgi:hypothetical protein
MKEKKPMDTRESIASWIEQTCDIWEEGFAQALRDLADQIRNEDDVLFYNMLKEPEQIAVVKGPMMNPQVIKSLEEFKLLRFDLVPLASVQKIYPDPSPIGRVLRNPDSSGMREHNGTDGVDGNKGSKSS